VKKDEMRTTLNYSWPVPGIPLAEQVCSPNATIDQSLLPRFEWFSVSRFHEQIYYLKQLGVPLE